MHTIDIIPILQNKITYLSFLTIGLVGMMMMLLVPLVLVEVNAEVNGRATAPPGTTFSYVSDFSDGGRFTSITLTDGGSQMMWNHIISNRLVDEKGSITVGVWQSGKQIGLVKFDFVDTGFGSFGRDNECNFTVIWGPLHSNCSITSREPASVTFDVSFRNPQNGNSNSLCDILFKFGDFEQSKIIRDKLHC